MDTVKDFKGHPQADIIISDLERLVGNEWRYTADGRYIAVGNCSYLPHEIIAFCDGIRYQRKITLAKLEGLING